MASSETGAEAIGQRVASTAGRIASPPDAVTTSSLHLELSLPPEWGRIESIRAAVALCVRAAFVQQDLDDTMSMVSAELLENAVKYGLPRQIRFVLKQEGGELSVTVTNEVEPGSPHVDLLRGRLAWIASFPHPSEAYLAALRQIYEETADRTSGGLGMVRIAYEGGCRIECDDSQPGRVTVHARHTPSRRELSKPR